MRLKVEHIEVIADRVKRFRFVSPDGSPLPSFVPGAHLELTLDTPDGKLVRQYSLVSSPNAPYYEIAVLHTESSRGGSRFLHGSVKSGDLLEVSTPRGSFRLAERAAKHTLIAGGIGITPLYALASSLKERSESYHLHYSARSHERMAFADPIGQEHASSSTLYVDRDGGSSLDLESVIGSPDDDHHLYVCGPRAMIEAVKRIATERGFRAEQVHFETFGAVSVTKRPPVRLHLLQSDLTIVVPPEKSLLEAMEEAGAWVNSDCRRGDCGKCTLGYSDGEVEHLDVCLTDEARRTQFTPCISRALSDSLSVDA
jgi:ferredoxin-NADP reductase